MHPSRILREHRLVVVVLTITAGMGMTVLALFLEGKLPIGQWGLFVVGLSGTAIGFMLGYHTQRENWENLSLFSAWSMYKMAFGVAWRIGTIWVVLAGCIEYGVTFNISDLPTTSVTVTHYPVIFSFFTSIIASGFSSGYIAFAAWNRIRVRASSVSVLHIWNVVRTLLASHIVTALTGIAALIISVITLYVTLQQNKDDLKQRDYRLDILKEELRRKEFENFLWRQYSSDKSDDVQSRRRIGEEDNSQ